MKLGLLSQPQAFLQGLKTELEWIFATDKEREKVSSSLQSFLHYLVFAAEKTSDIWSTDTPM